MYVEIIVVGGGFLFEYDGMCMCVGFKFVGVFLGFVVYWNGGFFMVMDVNILVGKIVLKVFLYVFGFYVDCFLDNEIVVEKFKSFVKIIGDVLEVVVDGFI